MSSLNKNTSRSRRHARLRARISGTKELPRLAIFRSNKAVYAQLIDDVSGTTLASSSSLSLGNKKGVTPVQKAEEVGKAVAEKAIALGVKKVVFDRGGFRYAGRVKVLAEAARSGGLTF
jgi:large subunit ribosomal protein L18